MWKSGFAGAPGIEREKKGGMSVQYRKSAPCGGVFIAGVEERSVCLPITRVSMNTGVAGCMSMLILKENCGSIYTLFTR